MSIRKILLNMVMDLQVNKIVVRGAYLETFVYHLPIEFKKAIEQTLEDESEICIDEKLNEILKKLDLDLDYKEFSKIPLDDKLMYWKNKLYKCLPNRVFYHGSGLFPHEKITIETKENIIIQNVGIDGIKKNVQDVKFDNSNLKKEIKDGCLVKVFSMFHHSVCEFDLQQIPIKQFEMDAIRFMYKTYEILSDGAPEDYNYKHLDSILYKGKEIKTNMVFKGEETFHHSMPWNGFDEIGGKRVIISAI